MTVGERIKLRRKELNISADKLAEKIGVSRSTIFRYEKGDIEKMPTDVLNGIAIVLNTTPGSLMGWENNNSKDILPIYNNLLEHNQEKVYTFASDLLEKQNSNIVDLREWKDVDIYSVMSAGTGIIDLEPEYKEKISYNGYVPPKYDMAFKVSGDSMEPLFEDGEVIFVEIDSEVRNGQIGTVLINGEAYVKKMYIEDKQLRLVSLNKKYEDIIANETDDIKVVGRVII